MTPRNINATATASSRPRHVTPASERQAGLGFATLGRAPLRMSLGTRRITSTDLQIIEATDELLNLALDSPETTVDEFGGQEGVSLLKGFNATIPSADKSRTRRRMMRNVDAPKIGLKKLGMSARGMLTEGDSNEEHEGQSVVSDDDMVVVGRTDERGRKGKGKRRGRESLSTAKKLGKDELRRQTKEIMRDKENIHVRRVRISISFRYVQV